LQQPYGRFRSKNQDEDEPEDASERDVFEVIQNHNERHLIEQESINEEDSFYKETMPKKSKK